jgi:uncharacterized protein YjbI with pentapeptide repeats
MEPLKIMTDEIRDKIKFYNKKHIDIKELITGYSISNENLSGAYISELNLAGYDISNCNLSRSNVKLILNKGVARNCNFSYTQFILGSNFSHADCRGSNFSSCNASNIDFVCADLRGTSFCNSTFTLFSKRFFRAKFDGMILELMARFLSVEGLKEIKNEDI